MLGFLMTWLSLDSVLGVCVPSPFCVLDRSWNSIVVIHDHWIFICFEQKFDFLLSQYRMSLVIIKIYQLSYHLVLFIYEPQHDLTKWHVRPAKTQISLGIRPVWSESSLSAWRKLGSLATHWAHSEDSDWVDAQADLSLRWAHSHFVCFVMRRLIRFLLYTHSLTLIGSIKILTYRIRGSWVYLPYLFTIAP